MPTLGFLHSDVAYPAELNTSHTCVYVGSDHTTDTFILKSTLIGNPLRLPILLDPRLVVFVLPTGVIVTGTGFGWTSQAPAVGAQVPGSSVGGIRLIGCFQAQGIA